MQRMSFTKKLISLLLIVVMLLTSVPFIAFSSDEDEGTYLVTVKDAISTGIKGVTVVLENTADSTVLDEKTDEDGVATFKNVAYGTYDISYSSDDIISGSISAVEFLDEEHNSTEVTAAYAVDCHSCNGTGKVACDNCNGTGILSTQSDCATCDGTGTIETSKQCENCAGTGKVTDPVSGGEIDCEICTGMGIVKEQSACTDCEGSGKITNQSNCPVCGATGNVVCTECSGTGIHEAYEYSAAVFTTVNYRDIRPVIDKFTYDGEEISVNTENMTIVSDTPAVIGVDDSFNMVALGKAGQSATLTITIPFDSEHGYAPLQIDREVKIEKSTQKDWGNGQFTVNGNLIYNAQEQVLLQPIEETTLETDDLVYTVTKEGEAESVKFKEGNLPAFKDAGKYTVVISSANYDYPLDGVTVMIAKKDATVVPEENQEKAVGQFIEKYDIQYHVDGEEGTDKVSLEGALSYDGATAEETVGDTYPIIQGSLKFDDNDVNKNYNLVFDDTKALTIIDYQPGVEATVLDLAEGQHWFNKEYMNHHNVVTIQAPEGFQISDTPTRFGDTHWADALTVSDDGDYNYRYYLRNNDTGAIAGTVVETDAVFGIDTQIPVLDEVVFQHTGESRFEETLNFLTFGTFFKEQIKAKVKTSDPLKNESKSEVANVQVYIKTQNENLFFTYKDGTFVYKEDGNDFVYPFEGEEQAEGTVWVIVTDTAGNEETYQVTDDNSNIKDSAESPVVMLENGKPDVTISDEADGPNNSTYQYENKNVYTADAKFTIDITDVVGSNLVSGLNKAIVKVNKQIVVENDYSASTSKTKNDQIVITTAGLKDVGGNEVTADKDGKYTIIVEGADNAGNAFVAAEDYIYVDRHAPMVTEFKLIGDPGTTNGDYKPVNNVIPTDYGYYFKDSAEVEVSVKDKKESKELLSGVKELKIYLQDITIDQETQQQTLYTAQADGTLKRITSLDDVQPIGVEKLTPNEADKTGDAYSFTFTVEQNFKGQIFAMVVDNAGNNLTNNTAPTDYKKIVGEDFDINTSIIKNDSIPNEGYQMPLNSIIEKEEHHYDVSSITIEEAKAAKGFEASKKDQLSLDTVSASNLSKNAKKDKVMFAGVGKKIPLYNYNPDFKLNIVEAYAGIREVKLTLIEQTGSQVKTCVNTVTVGTDAKTEITNTIAYYIDGKAASATDFDSVLAQNNMDIWNVQNTTDNILDSMSTEKFHVAGNSNDMVLLVELTDRAGNISYDYFKFGIDKTKPVIRFTEDTTVKGNHAAYYNGAHDITITVTERNFDPQDLTLKIVNDDNDALPGDYAKGNKKTGEIFQFDKWKENYNTTNPDATTYTYVLTVPSDGHYNITASLIDLAKNKSNEVNTSFWIDSVAPVVTVEYNLNNDTAFYNQTRVATITVVDHNFDLDSANKFVDFKNESTAKNNGTGADVEVNGLSQWTKVGNDTYSITVTCEEIANYVLKFLVMDMAGNQVEINEPSFDVDTKAPTFDMYITEEKENDGLQKEDVKSAYKYSDTITPYFVVNDDDGNLDTESISINIAGARKDSKTLKAVHEPFNAYADEQGRAEIANVASKQNAEIVTGQKVTLNWYNSVTQEELKDDENYAKRRERENLDDVYYLTVSVKDKAGNETTYNKVYSVNRYGSNFLFDFTSKSGYRSNYEGNLAFFTKDVTTAPFLTEINPDSIDTAKTTKIVLNGVKELKEGKDYSIQDVYAEEKAKNDEYDNWHEYKYTLLNKDGLFSKDNKYVLSVSDKDDAGNANSNSNTKNRREDRNPKYDVEEICFVVDNNAPVIDLQAFLTGNKETDVSRLADEMTIKNSAVKINENVTPQDGAFTFNVKISEKSLGLEAIDFKEESFRVSYGDESTYIKLNETKTPGLYSFSIPEMHAGDLGQDLTITIKDKAGNQSTITIEKFTATTNPFVKFLANRVAVIITACAFVLALAAVVFIIIKTRKKAEDED